MVVGRPGGLNKEPAFVVASRSGDLKCQQAPVLRWMAGYFPRATLHTRGTFSVFYYVPTLVRLAYAAAIHKKLAELSVNLSYKLSEVSD